MKLWPVLILAVGLLLAADARKGNTPTKDAERMQGTWRVVSIDRNGKPTPDDVIQVLGSWVIRGDRLTAGEGVSTFQPHPSQEPKAIDLTLLQEGVFLLEGRGIYSVEGDTLKLCVPFSTRKERPAEFTAKAGSK